MDTATNYTTMHLGLNQVYVIDMTYLNDLSNKACVLNKTEDLNIHVFSLITDKKE